MKKMKNVTSPLGGGGFLTHTVVIVAVSSYSRYIHVRVHVQV